MLLDIYRNGNRKVLFPLNIFLRKKNDAYVNYLAEITRKIYKKNLLSQSLENIKELVKEQATKMFLEISVF